MELVEAGRSTRHAGRQRPDERGRAARLAVLSEVHIVRRCSRSGLAEIKRPDFIAEAGHGEAAAPQIPRRRVNDGQGKGRCDRGIGRVTARAEDLETGLSGRRSGAGDGAAGTAYGLRMGRLDRSADQAGKCCEDQECDSSTTETPDIRFHCRSVAELFADFVRIDLQEEGDHDALDPD
jgi:hypothetical protein